MIGTRGDLRESHTTEETLQFLDLPEEFLDCFFDGSYTTRLFPRQAVARAAVMSSREFLESDDDDQWKIGREWFKVDKKGKTVYQGRTTNSVVLEHATARASQAVGEYPSGRQQALDNQRQSTFLSNLPALGSFPTQQRGGRLD